MNVEVMNGETFMVHEYPPAPRFTVEGRWVGPHCNCPRTVDHRRGRVVKLYHRIDCPEIANA